MVVSDLAIEQPKTRLLAAVLRELGLTKTTLIITDPSNGNLERAARNLRHVKLLRPEALNVYDVLRYETLVIPEREVSRLQEVWS